MLWALPLALSAAGAIASNAGANQARKAQQNVAAAEALRQRQYQDAANSAITRETLNFDAPKVADDMAATDARRGQAFQTAIDQPTGYQQIAPTASAPEAVSQVFADLAGKAKATGAADAAAAARFGSVNDWLGDRGRSLMRTGQEVGQQQSFMRGSSAILPIELKAAANKGANLRGFGNLLGSAGNLAALYTLFSPTALSSNVDSGNGGRMGFATPAQRF